MFKPGDRVHIADDCGPLGLLETPGSYKFSEKTANAGDECEVVSYDGQMPDGWMLVLHIQSNLFAPVHPGMLRES